MQDGYGELPKVCKTQRALAAWEWVVVGGLGLNECLLQEASRAQVLGSYGL